MVRLDTLVRRIVEDVRERMDEERAGGVDAARSCPQGGGAGERSGDAAGCTLPPGTPSSAPRRPTAALIGSRLELE